MHDLQDGAALYRERLVRRVPQLTLAEWHPWREPVVNPVGEAMRWEAFYQRLLANKEAYGHTWLRSRGFLRWNRRRYVAAIKW